MAKDSNIVHEYFKKEFSEGIILVKVNPVHYTGIELTVLPDGKVSSRQLEFDSDIHEDLALDGFQPGSSLEFNLYFAGLL
ncbi:MAG: hypothetical protein WKF87_22435 [Chryseolinea sp.]